MDARSQSEQLRSREIRYVTMMGLRAVCLILGAVFLGLVTDAMLLGHWYLVQPGLSRGPIIDLVRFIVIIWPLEVAVWLIPTGMPRSIPIGTVRCG